MSRPPRKVIPKDAEIDPRRIKSINRKIEELNIDVNEEYSPQKEREMVNEVENELALEELTPKENAFINAYLICNDDVEAAIQANFSSHSARRISKALLASPKIKHEIRRRQKNLNEKMGNLHQAVVEEYAKLAFGNIQDIFDEDGKITHPKDMDRNTSASITSFETERKLVGRGEDAAEVEVTKVKMADKKQALDALGKHIGFFTADKDAVVEFGLKNLIGTFPKEFQEQVLIALKQKMEQKQIGN